MSALFIKNARWLTNEGQFSEGTIVIENGIIAELSNQSTLKESAENFDARGMLVLPGVIDTHVHFREPGQLYKEGIESGSKAALKGGVTTVLDMPNNVPPCSTKERILEKKALFGQKSLVNWGVLLHASQEDDGNAAGEAIAAKIYMAKSSALPAITDVAELESLFRKYERLSFHAEDETEFIKPTKEKYLHHEIRPREAVISALQKIETAYTALPEKERPRIIICHMNTKDEVEWLKRVKAAGYDIWGETCPHYLFFTQDEYNRKGNLFKVNPPIRTAADRDSLCRAIADGTIDFIGTDHAPHTEAEKHSDNPPSGIAAIEWLMPQMLYFIDKQIISWKRLYELMCGGAARAYGIVGRDGIRVGNFADLTCIEKVNANSSDNDIQTKVGINLYAGFEFNWRVRAAFVNGRLKYDGRRFLNSDIKGKGV